VTRRGLIYSERQAPVQAEGFDADVPVAGFYRTRLARSGVYVGVKVWFGQPKDPVTGELLDRSLRWQAEANGAPIDLERVWPGCAEDPITEQEHAFLIDQQRWGAANAPDSPQANPTRSANPLTSPLLF